MSSAALLLAPAAVLHQESAAFFAIHPLFSLPYIAPFCFQYINWRTELSSNLTKANNILTNMESNLMAINTYHMTLNTSNVKTPDSWIECNRIGNLVMINGCAKITKAVNTYSVLNIASGAPVPCCNKQLYTVAIAQDNTYSNCFLEVSKSGAVNLLVRWQKASSGDIFYYEFCYICK